MQAQRRRIQRQQSNLFSALTEHQITEFKEAFDYIDHNGDGGITLGDLRETFAAMGPLSTMNELELQQMLNECSNGLGQGAGDVREAATVKFPMFLSMMAAHMQGVDEEPELLKAFEQFDEKKSGTMCYEDFREYMTTMGDRLTEEEYEAMMRGVELDDHGHFNYRGLVKLLTHGE